MIDFLNSNTQGNPLNQKIHLSFAELITLVSVGDQEVLKLAFEDNLKGIDLAAASED